MYRLLEDTEKSSADLDKAASLGKAWLQAHASAKGTATFAFYRNVVAQAYNQKAVLAKCVQTAAPVRARTIPRPGCSRCVRCTDWQAMTKHTRLR